MTDKPYSRRMAVRLLNIHELIIFSKVKDASHPQRVNVILLT